MCEPDLNELDRTEGMCRKIIKLDLATNKDGLNGYEMELQMWNCGRYHS